MKLLKLLILMNSVVGLWDHVQKCWCFYIRTPAVLWWDNIHVSVHMTSADKIFIFSRSLYRVTGMNLD